MAQKPQKSCKICICIIFGTVSVDYSIEMQCYSCYNYSIGIIPDFGSEIADIEWVTTAKHIGVIFQKEDYHGSRLWLFLREMWEGIFRILGTRFFVPNGI